MVMLKDRILTLRYKNEHESRKVEADNYSQFKVEIKEPSIFFAVVDIEMNFQKLVYPEGDNHIPLEFNKCSFLYRRIICNTVSFLHVSFVFTEL